MALATKCPHCGTVFKVAADQLKLRGGIVRCGKCSEVFDGNAALVDPEAALQRPVPIPESAEPASEPEPEETPVYTLDFDTAFEPLGIIPKPGAPENEQTEDEQAEEAAEPEAGPTPQLDIDFDLDLVPPAPPADQPGTVPTGPSPDFDLSEPDEKRPEPTHSEQPQEPNSPEPAGVELQPEAEPDAQPLAPVPDESTAPVTSADEARDSEPAAPATSIDDAGDSELVAPATSIDDVRDSEPAPADASADLQGAELLPGAMATESSHAQEPEPVQDEVEEPGFVTRVRKKEKATRVARILMAFGSVLLLAALLAQGVISFASVLAARYPQAKPALTEACKLLRCQVTLPAQIDMLAVETGELQTIADNTFLFATVLRNDSTLVQAWPHIELALTDANDKTLVRRVIKPAEYLPRADASRGFAAKTEQPVKVYFQLTGVTASGYHIAIFYP